MLGRGCRGLKHVSGETPIQPHLKFFPAAKRPPEALAGPCGRLARALVRAFGVASQPSLRAPLFGASRSSSLRDLPSESLTRFCGACGSPRLRVSPKARTRMPQLPQTSGCRGSVVAPQGELEMPKLPLREARTGLRRGGRRGGDSPEKKSRAIFESPENLFRPVWTGVP